MGNGGSDGSNGVLLGCGVGVGVGVGVGGGDGVGGGSDGVGGATVGEVVPGGGAVGAAVAGTDGAGVRVPGVATGLAEAAGAGAVEDGAEPLVGVASGDVVAVVGESAGACWLLPESRVRLNPARARPTASEGPRRTYKVKEARPRWPEALSLCLPSSPPTLGRYFLPRHKAG